MIKTLARLNRRAFLASALALGSVAALPLQAQASPEDNLMPAELRRALERDPIAPVLGNPKGDITLSEFFDYNCPFCRKMVPTIHGLTGEDNELRVVFRELPVFGEGSEFAARASLASLKQGKYWQFHKALMAMTGKAEEASVLSAAQSVGLDVAALREEMEHRWVQDHIYGSLDLADHMGLMGTPTFIAGNEALFGKQSAAELRGLVAGARKAMS